MKHKLLNALALVVLTMAIAGSTARAQTLANGPYYANPSWDQTLPSSTRFIVLSNFGGAAVLDRETGLVWQTSPDSTQRNFSFAQITCNNLSVGNRLGWRLPTFQELASLVDRSVSPGLALPAGHPFTNVQSTAYWSATTSAGSTDSAWALVFDGGVPLSGRPKVMSTFVWCVRGGQGVDPQ